MSVEEKKELSWYDEIMLGKKEIEEGIAKDDKNYFQCDCDTLYKKVKCANCGRDIWETPWREGRCSRCEKIRSQLAVHCGCCHQVGCIDCTPWDASGYFCITDCKEK